MGYDREKDALRELNLGRRLHNDNLPRHVREEIYAMEAGKRRLLDSYGCHFDIELPAKMPTLQMKSMVPGALIEFHDIRSGRRELVTLLEHQRDIDTSGIDAPANEPYDRLHCLHLFGQPIIRIPGLIIRK